MNVKIAFLNKELDQTVYMEILEGLFIPAAPSSAQYHRPLPCRLLRSICGLKQSPRAWCGRIHTFFITNNLVRSDSDHSLFITYDKSVILVLYVNDLVLASPSKDLIDWIHTMLYQ